MLVLVFFLAFQKATLGTGSPSRTGPRPSAAWGFAGSKPVFPHPRRRFGFLLGVPESHVKHWEPEPAGLSRPSAAWGFASPFWSSF